MLLYTCVYMYRDLGVNLLTLRRLFLLKSEVITHVSVMTGRMSYQLTNYLSCQVRLLYVYDGEEKFKISPQRMFE